MMDETGRRALHAEDLVEMESTWRADGLRVFSALAGVTLLGFSIANFAAANLLAGLLTAGGIPLALWSWRLAQRGRPSDWAAAPIMLYLTALFAFLVVTGHAGSATVMYFGAGPALAIFGLGARRGLALAFVYLGMTIFAFVVNDHPLPGGYVARFLVAFVFASVVAFMYERARERAIARLGETRARLRKLETLLPICAWCRQVNADEDGWVSIEEYLANREQPVTHGLCPTCAEREMPALETPSR